MDLIFWGASEAKTEEDRCKHKQTKTKTPAGISPHVTLHSPPTVIKGGGCMRRRDRISKRPSCSWCDFTVLAKVQTGAFGFFFQTHTRLIGPSTRQSNHELSVRTDSEQAIRPVMWLDVHLERLQYASHTLHTHWNANCEYSGMTPQLTINKFI